MVRKLIILLMVIVIGIAVTGCADTPPIDKNNNDIDKSFKVLAVGNSFSEDALTHLYHIAAALGKEEVVIANLYIGGCSLDTHYNNAKNNYKSYQLQVYTEKKETLYFNSIEDGIKYSDWDYITLQQASPLSGQADSYDFDKIKYLTDYFKQYSVNPDVKIAWHATWAYQSNYKSNNFKYYDNNQMIMYNSINDAIREQIVDSDNFDLIIPNTTAIQNARTSYLGDNLTRDGYHLSLKEGRYIAALMYYKALTGEDINTLIAYNNGYLELKEDFLAVAIQSVDNAYKYPYKITEYSEHS